MRQEALDNLDNEAFTAAVRDVLEDEPDGLDGKAIRRRVSQHPDYDLVVPMKYLHNWLAELNRDGEFVIDHPNDDYRANHRYGKRDEFGRHPLFTSQHGRPHKNTVRS